MQNNLRINLIAWIKKSSNVLGSRTAMELKGIPCINLETTTTKKKKLCCFKIIWKKS